MRQINKIKRWCAVLLILLFIAASALAKQPIPKGLTLKQSAQGYTMKFQVPKYEFLPETGDGEDYSKLSIDSYGVNADSGLPSLPQCSFNFIIPQGSKPKVSIEDIITREEKLSKHLYPVQQPWPKSKPLSERPFTINRDYYKSEGSKQKVEISVSEPFVIAGVTGITVTVYPFEYNPSQKILEIIESMTIHLDIPSTQKRTISKSTAFDDIYNSSFVNSLDDISNSSSAKENPNYLIITAPSFQSSLSQFVNFRQHSGMVVDLFSTDQTGTTTTQIKTFIQTRYNNLTTRPAFILLVGDVAQIPAWTSTSADNPANDLYYSTLDGADYFPDAYVGRFSVTSTTELSNIINKTIYMDSLINDISKKAVFLASNDNYTISEGTHNYVISNYLSLNGYSSTKRYSVSTSATTAQVLSDINQGQTFCVYSGHGSEQSWADGPPVSQSQLRSLTNTVYPFVYAFTCLSGSYSNTAECFGETWIRIPKGASSYTGSSVTSYWDEDDILEKRIFKAIYQDSITQNGPSFNRGKIELYNYYSGAGRTLRYFEQYNLLGDPALSLYLNWTPGIDLKYSSTIISESNGNNDGILNPGETGLLRVSLKNIGTTVANSVSATLTCSDSYITIGNNTSSFGQINPRGTIGQALDQFSITVSSQCPTPRTVPMHLTIHDASGGVWNADFTIQIMISSIISGYVRIYGSNAPLPNATVNYTGPSQGSVITDANGFFAFTTINGAYSVSAQALGYFPSQAQVFTTPPGASNLVFLLSRPQIQVDPASITDVVQVGNTKDRILTIRNTGFEPLNFGISIQENKHIVVPAESLYDASHFAEIPKGKIDTRVGRLSVKGSGGPDNFGYRWKDSDAPDGPAYTWEDISSIGQALSLSDDAATSVTLNFPFKFYGTEYRSMYVCSNGYISFGTQFTSYTNTAMPSTATPNNFVAAFWDDLNPSYGGTVYYKSYSDRAIVQYQAVAPYSGSGTFTFQIVVHSTGKIMCYYKSMNGTLTSSTIGIENSSGSDGFSIAYNATYLHNLMALCIMNAPEWITATPASGIVPAQASQLATVRLSAVDVLPGVYNSSLLITHNDPTVISPLLVPVTMTVSDHETLTLLPMSTGTSVRPADRSGQLILENITAGSPASGLASGDRFKLFLR